VRRRIVKRRTLPAQGRVLASTGMRVEPDTVVAVLDYIPGQLHRFNVAGALSILPEHLSEALMCSVGEWVEEGEEIAGVAEFHCPRVVRSPRTGYVGLVSRYLGDVFIREPIPASPKGPVTLRAEDFGLSAFAFATSVAVSPGKTVEIGSLLAGGLAGGACMRSPAFGRVAEVSKKAGTITIIPLYHPTEVRAHIAGTVTAVEAGESVEITATGHLVQGAIGYGGEKVGVLRVIDAAGDGNLDVRHLPETLAGEVVVAQGSATAEAVRGCVERGAVGLVLGGLDHGTLSEFVGDDALRRFGTQADTPMTVILMQGFGEARMGESVFGQLRALDGRRASLDGSTQLRAGVVRPEVIVTDEDDDADLGRMGGRRE
jgi:hypothetical protein